MGVFHRCQPELDFPRHERETLAFWKKEAIFQTSLERSKGKPSFVFYEGPPTANGLPHNGHVLTRVIKDLFPRYKSMRGYDVPRKAGWDTHGLPVEVEVEKELRIHGKAEIVKYGIEPFAKKCLESVFRYTDEWEKLTERIAFWVDLEQAYVTYHKEYVESVWWALSELFKKGLLYQGHKVVWWWAQGGTALSSGEVGLGYKSVDDPSVYVSFPLKDGTNRSLLVWTTTPWTLPSNMYAAVNPKHTYVEAKRTKGGDVLVVAKDLVPTLDKKLGGLEIVGEISAKELIGLAYEPPYDVYTKEHNHRVIAADFVTLDAGTGIVHIAPAFGEDDFTAHKKVAKAEGKDATAPLCAIAPDGTFTADMPQYQGKWVKDCDKDIIAELKAKGRVAFAEQYRHDYPFCWRSDADPLIQFARPAWYIRTTELIDNAIANNKRVEWMPDHIKEGRFGDFLANNVDWALSRERYWGTPLNVWINDETGAMEAPASVDEILKKNPRAFDSFYEEKKKDPTLSEHLLVHKPWIDAVTWQNPGEKGTYRRVPEVIDCWFDSGCMPFAQWGFPHKGHEDFKRAFPADFISEAIDQTRGWFYSLLMISTLVFDEAMVKKFDLKLSPNTQPHPYKTCIVLGHVCDKEGRKESKSKGNYTPPDIILDEVKMDFAVLEHADGVTAEKGVVFIAREDMEGLDVNEGAALRAFCPETREKNSTLTVKVAKKLRRRVAVVSASDRDELGLKPTKKTDVSPVEVPRLPVHERITLLDPSAPAPGADAFRWFFFAASPPWSNTRHSLSNVRALQKETLVKLRNVYSFFTIYANIDNFDPSKEPIAGLAAARTELDHWIEGELELTLDTVTRLMDAYDVYNATQRITEFVESLSNWYVRRSRDRFWRSGWDADKESAYRTLHRCLVEISKGMAPFIPFLADEMYRNLTGPLLASGKAEKSVHLEAFPTANLSRVDEVLSAKMSAVRSLVSLGLQVRTNAKLKVRQPLGVAHVIVADAKLSDSLASAVDMIKDELNVLSVEFVKKSDAERFVSYRLKPNFRTLGQRGLGKEAQALKGSFATFDGARSAEIALTLAEGKKITVDGVELGPEDVEIAFDAKESFAAAGDRTGVVVLDTRIDDKLKDLGLFRELQSKVQAARKEAALDFSDRVVLYVTANDRVKTIVTAQQRELMKECLITEIRWSSHASQKEIDVEGEPVHIGVERVG